MQNEKLQINLAPGMTTAEVILREGAAVKQLEPKAPVKTDLKGVIGCVVEYLTKRINAGQFDQKDCHILIDRDNVEITLITNEADEYTRGKVVGKLSYNPKFVEFGIVAFVLLSPGAQATLEDLRDKVIDKEIERIKEIAPEIAIIEV